MRLLLERLKADPLLLADVGSSGGPHPRWARLGEGVKVVPFDADSRAVSTPVAVDETNGSALLHVCRAQTATSLLAPNQETFGRFPEAQGAVVERTVEVETRMLDDLVDRADFIKLDTQGTEPRILRGAARVLASCIGIEAEVCLAALYEGQEGFGGLERVLGPAGFELFDIAVTWWHRPQTLWAREKGQAVFADTLWLRRPEDVPRERVAQAVGILIAYGQPAHASVFAAALGDEALAEEARRLSRRSRSFRGQGRVAGWLWRQWLGVAPQGRGWFMPGPGLGS